ncbi:NAD(P)/FAD-dependent oxidoreductase [Candidatus Bathyarchaeota archaeon]|nr:NAD(P)/FAD-dependent oxidoreductase [Candidatus Bathyarchaeota archaeon]
MENFSDVIVVGGGPCGSFSALNLSKKGFNVTVFEEHDEIGVPCHCAGHVSINGLKNLGLYPLPKGIVENTFVGAKFYSPNGTVFTVRLAKPITCVINRTLFDKYVAELAQKFGAHYSLGTRVKSPVFAGRLVKGVVIRRYDKSSEFFGRITLDAEGISAGLLKQVLLTPPKSDKIVKGAQVEVENVKDLETDIVEVILGRNYAPGFYAWLIPKNEMESKVGLATKTGNPRILLQRLISKHPAVSVKLRTAKIIRESYHPITLGGPIPKAYTNGFLAVGDAASQVKPTTGGGIILGLNCARIAADVAAEALDKNDFSAEFLGMYQRRFMKMFGFDMKIMLKIKETLDGFSDKKLDNIIGLCEKIRLNEVFKNLKEVDFQGRTLLKLAQNPKALTLLAFLFLNYLLGKP